MLFGSMRSKSEGQKFVTLMAGPNLADLSFMKELLETGKVVPFIDRCVPLSEAAAALTYVENRHVRGKVVITVAQNN
jgi:NADPH:quinone reductase-like Zn-dependent oxidoreductase